MNPDNTILLMYLIFFMLAITINLIDKKLSSGFNKNINMKTDKTPILDSNVSCLKPDLSRNTDNLSRLEVLRQINYEKEALSNEDAQGHIWWNKFEEMIKNI